jgi:Uri superfamily endonuclease
LQNSGGSTFVKNIIKNTKKRADLVVNSISGDGEHNTCSIKSSELSSDVDFYFDKILDKSTMRYNVPATPGIYSLVIDIETPIRVTIGAKGILSFLQGYYIYTGSARGRASMTLHTRLQRHLQDIKKDRWHIDYLLRHKATKVLNVFYFATLKDLECAVARSIIEDPLINAVHKGFGASDCRKGCYSHLSQARYIDLKVLLKYLSDVYRKFSTTHQVLNNQYSGL